MADLTDAVGENSVTGVVYEGSNERNNASSVDLLIAPPAPMPQGKARNPRAGFPPVTRRLGPAQSWWSASSAASGLRCFGLRV